MDLQEDNKTELEELVEELRNWDDSLGSVDDHQQTCFRAADKLEELDAICRRQMAEIAKLMNDILEKKTDILTIEEWVVIGLNIAKKKGKTPDDLMSYLKMASGLYSILLNDDWKEDS